MTQIAAFWRGFLIVTLTSLNVGQIAGHHYGGALLGGFAISFVWYGNAKAAALDGVRFGRELYALGAGCGTVVGMMAVTVIYG